MFSLVFQTITYPGDTVRRRMQANGLEGMPRTYTNSIDCFKKIVQIEGPLGEFSRVYFIALHCPCYHVLALFSGCRANVYRAIPGTAIQFWSVLALSYFSNSVCDVCRSYEAIKKLFGIEPMSGGWWPSRVFSVSVWSVSAIVIQLILRWITLTTWANEHMRRAASCRPTQMNRTA